MGQVPDQVLRQAERANELLNQANTPPAEATPAEPQVVEPQVEQPVEPPVESSDPPAAATPPEAAPHATPTAQPEGYEQRYRTLQGVFNAAQGTWQAERKVLEERLRALEQAAPPPSTAPVAPAPKASLITDKDLESYGPELLDVIGRKAAEMAEDIVGKRMAELKPVLDKTREEATNASARVYQNAQEKFYGELEKSVPDWQAINADERWLTWLAQVDPLAGVPRQVFLDNASNKLDHARAAKLFDAFKESAGLSKSATPVVPSTKPAISPSPRTVGTATAPTPREPEPGVDRTEIAAHYRRSSTDSAYRTSTEHKAMEERIARAMATNQVRGV